MELTEEEYNLILAYRKRREETAPLPVPHRSSFLSELKWFALSGVLCLLLAAFTANYFVPGSVSTMLGYWLANNVPGAEVTTIDGTPVAPLRPTAVVVVPAPASAPMVSQPIALPPTSAQQPAPPSPVPPTAAPAGVSMQANVGNDGVSFGIAVPNGQPAQADAADLPSLPQPGQPGFVQSFVAPPTLAPTNPWVGCLAGRRCEPNGPHPAAALPAQGEPGFVDSFK